MKYRWAVAEPDPQLCRPLESALGISSLLAHCLVQRQLTDPEAARIFLEPRLKSLSDPFRLPNMERAVERLFEALGPNFVII